jgi:hypothetical protein
MNTPRQPNVRPSVAAAWGRGSNIVPDSLSLTSFMAPFEANPSSVSIAVGIDRETGNAEHSRTSNSKE